MFIDGEFRWESDIRFDVKTTIRNANIVFPKLVKRIDPTYSPEAQAQGIRGTVRVQFRVGADGVVRDVVSVSGNGLSGDPRLRKAAEDAVKQWRYIPGTVDGKPAEVPGMTADFTFGG
jgi:TonB family protein